MYNLGFWLCLVGLSRSSVSAYNAVAIFRVNDAAGAVIFNGKGSVVKKKVWRKSDETRQYPIYIRPHGCSCGRLRLFQWLPKWNEGGKCAIAMCAETLKQLQQTMRLNPASRKYTLECIRDLTVPGTACV
jgi:hypothetical protein